MKLKIVNSAVSILKYYFLNFPIRELLINFDKETNLRIISKKTLRDFWEKHSDCKQQLLSWHQESSKSNWKTPNDIKKEYPSASFLLQNRIVFNIKGNTYRLIVKVNYEHQIIWIRFVGTHSEYDKIDANKI